ncbi:SLBB domain-containing protein [Roseivirga misakiensis]|uniref:SLBB domain-containing protein n=1 Tax=Roseivirga misakiensis TaxID=1563681 RepID=UPI00159F151B|nr:SLBB domain-containing protein [Roseivirga misakiensis]
MSAQGLGGIDLKSIRVDDLSDEQILGYIRQAEEKGLTQSQLEDLARQRGVSESEISKLRRRIERLRGGLSIDPSTSSNSRNLSRTTQLVTQEDVFGALSGQELPDLTENQKRIFGFDLFQTESLTFAPNLNLPTPENYVLGPQDVLIVDMWGATQQYLELELSSEGTVRPENLSPIYVNGLTIEKASEKIIARLSEVNSGLKSVNGAPPSIFYQVSLGNIRTINVNVVGEVARPSLYALPSLATVYTALHAAGGPTENGTFRDIRLIRDNKLVSSIDIYSFLTDGIRSGDQHLKNGDVIIVKPYKSRVEMEGKIKRPGLYELKQDERFEDLMKYTGGFTSEAFKATVTVKRNGDKEREIIDVDTEEFESFMPRDGDLIEVSGILDRFSNRVIIDGAVFREGEYQLTDGLTLKQLIDKAGGLRGDAYLQRATVYRTGEDFSQSTLPFDLGALNDGSIPDVPLLREDVVRITSIYDLREEYLVQISGEVQEEGVWPFFNQMTVKDLIVLAQGLKESASGALVEISRRNKNSSSNSTAEIIRLSIDEELSIKGEDDEMILEPFDQVYIRKSPGYTVQQQVMVEGEVVAPGLYTISRKDERISDILERAEGLTQYGDAKGAILIRKTEFSDAKSNDEISQEYLQQLRQKVLNDETELKNISQVRLIERLDKIGNKASANTDDDRVGSKFKKELIEDITEQDSLIKNIVIQDNEPVAIDLDRILQQPGSKFDLIVRPGDVISIPGKLETVRVAGEVTSPLNVRFDSEYSFKDYIFQSGGFLQTAKRGRSYVQYPNGERKGVRRFLFFKKYPKIEPGSTIFVSRKPERNGMSAQAWIGIGSGLATIGLVVVQAIRLTNNN